ncbi:MAG TPA: hypothetical protein VGX91_13560 [Candidatus Cybelea sp.]|jgi:hypothetical protein|nr:hypothetical protein [Candidatus Cybelea sp.]
MTSQLSNILNTLIILVALYAGGASACSFINEAIAGALQLRGSTLYRGLVDLLCGAREMVDELYKHPLVYPGNADETPKYNLSNRLWAFLGAENNWPSYLDARNFSVAFWQTLQRRLGTNAEATVANAANTPQQIVEDLQARVSGIDPSIPGIGPLKQTLAAMLASAGNDYQQLLKLTDEWFNHQMDRISGWYRRTSQWILLAFALALSFGLNVDTIHIVRFFNTETALATGVGADISKAYVAQEKAAAASATAAPSSAPGEEQAATAVAAARVVDQELSKDNFPSAVIANPGGNRLWLPILGELITAIAFAMGAPFWFDLLGTFMNVRMAGERPKQPAGPKK